ncbi:MAG: hypothetical protein K2O12_06335, partial [Muribaculaceae bacterium]|nr:hypothetical protein [Muribaculaceae bacterium]
FQPAHDPSALTVALVNKALDNLGTGDFIPAFDKHFHGINATVDAIVSELQTSGADCRLSDIDIKLPEK